MAQTITTHDERFVCPYCGANVCIEGGGREIYPADTERVPCEDQPRSSTDPPFVHGIAP